MEPPDLLMSVSSQGVALQVLSILSILACLSPLALHWKNGNYPAVSLICWFITLNLFSFVNALIWPTDDYESWWNGEGLCDVEVKIFIGSYVAVPGSLVCIFRSLAYVLDTSRATLVPSKHQRWKNRTMELLFCAFIPFVAAVMHIVWQGNRYYIFAISGCVTSFDQSWVSLVLGYIWPLVVCFIGSYYCALVLVRLKRYRSQFNEILRSNSGLSKSRFLRLFCLSFIMLLALIPMQTYMVYTQIKESLPWHAYSWSSLHGPNWGIIQRVPTGGVVYFDRWIPVAAGYMCFIFFGCGRDATKLYRAMLRRLGLDCCFTSVQTSTSDSTPRNTPGSTCSRAYLIPGTKNHTARAAYNSVSSGSTATEQTLSSNPSDLEKGLRTTLQAPKTRWWKVKAHLSWFGHPFKTSRREASHSAPQPAIPSGSNTISTNAWAGTSQSRGSIDLDTLPPRADFIRVKQVIRQEREMQI